MIGESLGRILKLGGADFSYGSDVFALLTRTVMIIIRLRSMPASSPAGDSNICSLIDERGDASAGLVKDWVL